MSEPVSAPARATRWWLLVAALVVVSALVGVLVVLTRDGSDPGATGTPPADPTAATTPSASDPASASPSTRPTPSPTPSSRPSSASPRPTASSPAAAPSRVPSASVPAPTSTGTPTVVPTASVTKTREPLREKSDLGNGVVVRVSKTEAVEGEAQGPGEVAGPALRISITVQNQTRQEIPMDLALVNVYYGGDATPASPLSGPGAAPLAEPVPAGGSATGRYVFTVPRDERDRVQVEFSYTTAAPTVVFSGAV